MASPRPALSGGVASPLPRAIPVALTAAAAVLVLVGAYALQWRHTLADEAERSGRLARALARRAASSTASPADATLRLNALWQSFGDGGLELWLVDAAGEVLTDSAAVGSPAAGRRLDELPLRAPAEPTLGALLARGFEGTVRTRAGSTGGGAAAPEPLLLAIAPIPGLDRFVILRRSERELAATARARWLPTAAAVVALAAMFVGLLSWGAVRRSRRHRREIERQHAQTMEALGRLAGGIAHDFNNLLTGMTGFLDLAIARLGAGHEVATDLLEVRALTERAAALVHRLLAFGRPQGGQPAVVDLGELLAGTSSWLGPMLGERIALQVDVQEGTTPVRIDPTQMDQVLLNLAVNARDAMPEGGVLRFTLRREERARRAIVRIVDTGAGMDERTRRRVFEPFFTTKREGSGLGLAMVFGIVKSFDGTIEVHSQRGRGTEFTLRFPLAPEPAAFSRPARVEAPAREPATVLVVENETTVREVVVRHLRAAGFETLAVGSAGEAERLLRIADPPVDLILADVVLPGRSGPRLAHDLRARGHRMPILFMSGHPADELGSERVEPTDLLVKPFAWEELVALVRRRVREARGRSTSS